MENWLARRTGGLCVLIWSAWASSACGGRAVTIETTSDSGGASSGGGTSSGSAVTQGGAASCVAPCTSCAAGMKLTTVPGACCPACVPNTCGPCAAFTCSSGYHEQLSPGACCPECSPDPVPSTCMQGQANYATLSQQIVTKFQTLPCTTAADCTVVGLSNACAGACQVFAVVSSESDSFRDLLSNAAQADCATCPAPQETLCIGPGAICNNAQCALSSP
jgi:hypothetical protein